MFAQGRPRRILDGSYLQLLCGIALSLTGLGDPILRDQASAAGAGSGRPAAGDPMALVGVGQVGGATFAIDSDGRYVYIGVGPRLVVADNSDPSAPRELGKTEPLGDVVRDVVVADHRAMVAIGAAGVAVVDVADGRHPRVVARRDTPGYAWALALDTNLYLADGPGDLRVFGIDGGGLREMAALELPGDQYRIAASDGHAYVVGNEADDHEWRHTGAVRVVDVNRPGDPRWIERGDASLTGVSAIAAAGHRLYVVSSSPADGLERLKAFDLDDPAAPTLVGSVEVFPGTINDISVRASSAAVATGSVHPDEGFVMLVDVADPSSPSVLALVSVSELGVPSVVLDGDRFVAALADGGIATFGIASGRHPKFLAAMGVGFTPVSSAVAGDTMYVAAGTSGLVVVDAHVPSAPVLRDCYYGPARGAVTHYSDIALSSPLSAGSAPKRAYLTSQHGDVVSTALRVFDLADPAGPREIAQAWEPGNVFGALDVTNRHAFVVADRYSLTTGLRVFDVASAITPTQVTTMTMRAPVDIALGDTHAYVADAGDGLRVLDIRDPTRLHQTAVCRVPGRATGVAVTARHILAVSRTDTGPDGGNLNVFDRSDPAQPVPLGAIDLPEPAVAVAAADGWACVAFQGGSEYGDPHLRSEGCLYLIDLHDPSRPSIAERRELPGVAESVTVIGDMVYASMDTGGLYILNVATWRRPPLYVPVAIARG